MHLFIVAGALTIVIVIMRIDKLVHRHVVFFGKAITNKRQTAVYIIKIFSVAGTGTSYPEWCRHAVKLYWQRRTEWVTTSTENAQQRRNRAQSHNASASNPAHRWHRHYSDSR